MAKSLRRLAGVLLVAVVCGGLSAAQAAVISFTNSNPITIPATGTSGSATPFPSPILVSGLTDAVTKVTVDIFGFSHAFPRDVDMLLVGPLGQTVMLMSDTGGGIGQPASNLFLTFDDDALSFIAPDASLVTGTYKPTNSDFLDSGDVFDAPAPAGPYGTLLSAFNGLGPNGTWSLFVRDDQDADIGQVISGWRLNLTTEVVPLPAAAWLLGSALLGLLGLSRRKLKAA